MVNTEVCVQVGIYWLLGYFDNEDMAKMNTQQMRKAIRLEIEEYKKQTNGENK